MGAGSSQHRENVNILEDMACYDFGEYRVSDVEFSPEVLPPCPPGFAQVNPRGGEEEEDEQEDPDVQEIPAAEAEDYAGVEEAIARDVAGEGASLPPQPYKSDMFIKHFRKVQCSDGTYKAHCNYCTVFYGWKKGGGYGTLTRHLKAKHPTEFGVERTQTQISRASMESRGKPFKYQDADYQEGLNKMICGLSLGFNSVESPELRYCHGGTLNPQAHNFGAKGMSKYNVESYRKRKTALKDMFHCLDTRVSICSDIWSDSSNERSFMGITAHWIDNNWVLNKRLIALRKMDGPHTASNIYRTLATVMNEYLLTRKIFSIGFDNASANTASISELQELCQPALGGTFFHIRCACHILNLCVKDGMTSLNIRTSPIKEAVDYISEHPSISREWRKWCKVHSKRPKKFKKDIPHRWNSTYLLLKSTVEYKELLCSFAIAHMTHINLHVNEWIVCDDLLKLLKIFYDATNTFSRVYTPSVHLFILEAGNIIGTLANVRSNPLLQIATNDMVEKWLKYYREIPMIYRIAWILDPRNKLEGLEDHLNYYYELVNQLSDTQDMYSIGARNVCQETASILSELYSQFSFIYGGQVPASPPTPVNIHQYGGESFVPTAVSLQNRRFKKHRSGGASSSTHSEIEKYYNTEFEFGDNVDVYQFEILDWWKRHSQTFPILSRIARQLLATPASTVAVEQVFSTVGYQLNDRKSSRRSVTIEAIACNNDWNKADFRTQDLKEITSSEDEFFSDYNSSGGSTAVSTPEHTQG